MAALWACPGLLMAQEADEYGGTNLKASSEIRIKYMPFSNERDIILKDYNGYGGEPDGELGLKARLLFTEDVKADIYPYFWHSEENGMARIGLFGEAYWEWFDDTLKAGWRHHSWHNADVDAPHNRGRWQDTLFVRYRLDEWLGRTVWDGGTDIEVGYFIKNTEPILIKSAYGHDEPEAFAEVALVISEHFTELPWKPLGKSNATLGLKLRPFVQFSDDDAHRYGISGEISFYNHDPVVPFVDFYWWSANKSSDDTYLVGIGVMIKFK